VSFPAGLGGVSDKETIMNKTKLAAWEPGEMLLRHFGGDVAAAKRWKVDNEFKLAQEREEWCRMARLREAREALNLGDQDPYPCRSDALQRILGGFFSAFGPDHVVSALIRFFTDPALSSAKERLAAAIVELIGDQLADAIAAAVQV